MSPRFSGPQHPGAMKDQRARKRAEAEARQKPRTAPMSLSDALDVIGASVAAPFIALADAFAALGRELLSKPEPTQDDFALVPHGDHVFVKHLDDSGWVLSGPRPGDAVENKTGRPEFVLTSKEWDDVALRAKEAGDER